MAKYLFESGIAAIQEFPSSAPRIHTHTHLTELLSPVAERVTSVTEHRLGSHLRADEQRPYLVHGLAFGDQSCAQCMVAQLRATDADCGVALQAWLILQRVDCQLALFLDGLQHSPA